LQAAEPKKTLESSDLIIPDLALVLHLTQPFLFSLGLGLALRVHRLVLSLW
ncbi:Uncharacterized protein DAT39_011910, partial [Clarias magur]